MRSRITRVIKKLVYASAENKTFDFTIKSISDPNAIITKNNKGEDQLVNQRFYKFLINNVSNHTCYVSTNKYIDANDSAEDGVDTFLGGDAGEIMIPEGFDYLDIRLEGAGTIYITFSMN